MSSPRMRGACELADRIQYTPEALKNDVDRLRRAWRKYQRSRRRSAVYAFLGTILEVATVWRQDGKLLTRCRNALAHSDYADRAVIEPFRALIVVAAQSPMIPDLTLSKWSRVLRFAADKKRPSMSLRKFVRRHGGGINNCASEFTRRAKRSISNLPEAFAQIE